MARSKQQGRKSRNRTEKGAANKGKDANVMKPLPGPVIPLKQPPLKWEMKAFLDHLHGQACFSTVVDFGCLFNKEEVKREVLKQQTLSFPSLELEKLQNLKSLPTKTDFRFACAGQLYYSKRSEFDGGISVQATGNSEDVTNEAYAALILSHAFGEGKLARYLFENFLTKRCDLLAFKACLYRAPEAEDQLPVGTPQPRHPKWQNFYNGKRKKERTDFHEATDIPPRLNIDEFLRFLPERNAECVSEKPKELAEVLKLPSEVVFALRDLGLLEGSMEQNKHNFKKKGTILEYTFFIQKPGSDSASHVYEAFAQSRDHARQACCALILAHYFGHRTIARQMLQRYVKNSPVKIILYDKPGSGAKNTLQIGDELKPFAEKLTCYPCLRKVGIHKAFALNAKPDTCREGVEVANAYQACSSPLQVLKAMKGPEFSFDNFLFLPVFTIPDYDQLYCCIALSDDEEEIKLPYFSSTSLYVSLQICCARLLNDQNVDRLARFSVVTKFNQIYRKEYDCYSNMTFVDCLPPDEILKLSNYASPWIVKKVIEADEEFEKAVKDKRILRDGPVTPEECDYMYEKIQLFYSFWGNDTFFDGDRPPKLGSQFLSGKRQAKTMAFGNFAGVDTYTFSQYFQPEDMEIALDFCGNHFVACLYVSNFGQFIAKSDSSSEDALNRAMQKALQLRKSLMSGDKNVFAQTDLCDLVNLTKDKLGLDLWQLTECIEPQMNKKFVAKLTVNDKVWSSKPCKNEVGALHELLVSVCSS